MSTPSSRSRAVALAAAVAALLFPGSANGQQLLRFHEGPLFAYEEFGWAVTKLADFGAGTTDKYAIAGPFGDLVKVYDGATGAEIGTLTGVAGSLFGYSLADAGDFDGDGFHDLLVGAPGDALSYGDRKGAFYVYSGNSRDTDFLTLIGSRVGADGDRMGFSVAGVGDLDGDTLDDVAIGIPGYAKDTGRVDTYHRDLFGLTALLWSESGTQAGAQFGFAVASAGIINSPSDSIGDVIVGEPYFDKDVGRVTYADAGAAHVLSGADGASIFTWLGLASGELFGFAVDGIGQANDDAYHFEDVVVGAPYHDGGGLSDTGRVVGYSGYNGVEFFSVNGTSDFDLLGYAVRGVRDDWSEQDGLDDFVAGAPGLWGSSGSGGAARVFDGTGGFLFEYGVPPTSEPTGFGAALACPDVQGDGQPDLLIGMPGDYYISDIRGSAWLYAVFSSDCVDYGAGWDGTLGEPACDCIDPADIGGRTTVFVGNSLGATTPGLLFVGLSAIDVPTKLGGHLLVGDVLFSLPLSIPASGITLYGDIPDDESLGGLSIFLQAIEIDPGASKGISFTDGLELALGWDY